MMQRQPLLTFSSIIDSGKGERVRKGMIYGCGYGLFYGNVNLFCTYEFSRRFCFLLFLCCLRDYFSSSLREGEESRAAIGGRRNWTHRLGNAPPYSCHEIYTPISYVHADLHQQHQPRMSRNRQTHTSARKAILLLPTLRRKGWEETICVYVRMRVWSVYSLIYTKPAFGSAACYLLRKRKVQKKAHHVKKRKKITKWTKLNDLKRTLRGWDGMGWDGM